MKVTVTLASGHAVELEGTQAEHDKWVRAIQGKARTISGAVHGQPHVKRTIVVDLIAAITAHGDETKAARKR